MQRDWLQDPQSLPFAQRIKTHALVSLVQKGLQYLQVEQSLDQASSLTRYQQHSLRLGSLGIGMPYRRQRFSLALNPEGHHHQRIKNNSTMPRKPLQGHVNMDGKTPLMDWAWTLLRHHQHQSDPVEATMGLKRLSTAIDKPTTVCKSIRTDIIINTSHLCQYRRLVILLQRTTLMEWISMKMPTRLVAPRRKTN